MRIAKDFICSTILATAMLSGCELNGDGRVIGANTKTPPGKDFIHALANAPASVQAFSTVLLDGSLSSRAAAQIKSHVWTQTSGPNVALTGSDTAQATFIAPQVALPTTLTFLLTVTDATGATGTASAAVRVMPASVAQLAPRFVNLSIFETFTGNDHNSLLPFDGPPLTGSTLTIDAALSGAVRTPVFTVVDQSGNRLSAAALTLAGSPSLQPLDFVGPIIIPSVPFRVTATGMTTDGQSYALQSPVLITPMHMTIAFVPPRTLLAPGASTAITLQIKNGGADANFTLAFNDPQHFLANSQAVSLRVAAGQTAAVPMTVTLPAVATGLINPKVAATGSVSGDPNRVGTATFEIWVNGAL